MKIKLVMRRWTMRWNNDTQEFEDPPDSLEHGNFHGGTTWNGTIDLSSQEWIELEEALEKGFKPVFEVMK